MPASLSSSMPEAAAPQRQRSIRGWPALWIVTAAVGLLLWGRDLWYSGGALSIGGDALWGRDFVNVYTSGALVLRDQLGTIYDVEAYRAFQAALFDGGLQNHNYSYPPVTLLYTPAFALLSYPAALLLWLAGTGAFFVYAARPYLRDAELPLWVAIAAPASMVNLWAGHYGFLIGGLWLLAWHHLPRRPGLSGLLIGLMLVKPHMAVLAPLVLLWRREWRAFAAATATVIALVGVSVLLFGNDLWVRYLTETAMVQAAMVDDVGTFFLTMMPTVTPALTIIGVPTGAALIIQAAVGIAAIAMLISHLPLSSRDAGLATATATFLVLPYGFAYDMTVAGLAGLLLFKRAVGGASPLLVFLAGMAALVPVLVMTFNVASIPVAPALLAFQLAALLGMIRLRTTA